MKSTKQVPPPPRLNKSQISCHGPITLDVVCKTPGKEEGVAAGGWLASK